MILKMSNLSCSPAGEGGIIPSADQFALNPLLTLVSQPPLPLPLSHFAACQYFLTIRGGKMEFSLLLPELAMKSSQGGWRSPTTTPK